MIFLHTAIIFAIVSTVAAQNYQPQPENYQPQPTSGKVLQIPEYVTLGQNPLISYTLQLPKEEAPNVPFYGPEVNLQPPKIQTGQNIPLYYEYPEPSVNLQAPSEGSWNPNNDPNYYYTSIPIIVDLEAPTNQHPKKFNKEIHEKKYSGEPKKEVVLKPVTSDELEQLQKTSDKFAKLENKKQINSEKAQQAVQI